MTEFCFYGSRGLVFYMRFRVDGKFTCFSGGNQAYGLPPACSFGVTRNFSIFILRFCEVANLF